MVSSVPVPRVITRSSIIFVPSVVEIALVRIIVADVFVHSVGVSELATVEAKLVCTGKEDSRRSRPSLRAWRWWGIVIRVFTLRVIVIATFVVSILWRLSVSMGRMGRMNRSWRTRRGHV
jgi:hypothetical protein